MSLRSTGFALVPLGLAVLVSFSQVSVTGEIALIRDAHLVTAAGGWVLVGQHLLTSEDGGASWKEITPPHANVIYSVYFRDLDNGYVLSGPTQSQPSHLDLATTSDRGRTWLTHSFTAVPQNVLEQSFAGGAHLNFVDARHGWLLLRLMSGSNFSFGELFSTADGGEVWKRLPAPPIAGEIQFVSRTTGWIAGGAAGGELYITQDAGETWSSQTVVAPPSVEITENVQTFYSLPTPPNGGGTGFLTATFNQGLASRWVRDTYVLGFYTNPDWPQHWELRTYEKDLPDRPKAAITRDGTLMRAFSDGPELVAGPVTKSGPAAIPGHIPKRSGVYAVSFSDVLHGWVTLAYSSCAPSPGHCTTNNFLVSTSDGGLTFVDRTPPVTATGRDNPLPADSEPSSASKGALTGAGQSADRIRIGRDVANANLLTKVEPQYPPAARQAGVQGSVEFSVQIGPDGHVEGLQLVRGHPLLVNAAKNAARQRVYRPFLLNGKAVAIITTVVVSFEPVR